MKNFNGPKRDGFDNYYIIKASGEKELFDPQKFTNSLVRVGASSELINKILDEIKSKERFFKTAREIYKFAFDFLRKYNKGIAGRYNLKNALYALGPTGFPFEKFVAQIFVAQNFDVKIDQICMGRCVSHEIDAIVKKGDSQYLVECKFHNRPGLKADVKIPLYIKARFDDIKEHWVANPKQNGHFHQAWIFTNTKFTWNAILYAKCVGIRLVGWSYPDENNLAQLIDKFGLHPITVLTSINRYQKKLLLENEVVLCKQLCEQSTKLKILGIQENKISQVLEEAKAVCNFKS
jgi:hypothetical protein